MKKAITSFVLICILSALCNAVFAIDDYEFTIETTITNVGEVELKDVYIINNLNHITSPHMSYYRYYSSRDYGGLDYIIKNAFQDSTKTYSMDLIPKLGPNKSLTILTIVKMSAGEYDQRLEGVSEPQENFDEEEFLNDYMKNVGVSESVSSATDEILSKLTKKNPTNVDKVLAVYEWITSNVEYDLKYAGQSVSMTLETKRATCVEYANLLESMCKYMGVPAKKIYGYAVNMNNYGVADISHISGHVWIQFYDKDHGWLIADPTLDVGKSPSEFKYFMSNDGALKGLFEKDFFTISTLNDYKNLEVKRTVKLAKKEVSENVLEADNVLTRSLQAQERRDTVIREIEEFASEKEIEGLTFVASNKSKVINGREIHINASYGFVAKDLGDTILITLISEKSNLNIVYNKSTKRIKKLYTTMITEQEDDGLQPGLAVLSEDS